MASLEIYTRDHCGYCVRAKRLLNERGIAYVEHNASHDPALRNEMITRSGRYTFPQVFIGQRHLGGSNELAMLARSGELDQALQQA